MDQIITRINPKGLVFPSKMAWFRAFSLLALLLPCAAYGQLGSIRGLVKDAETSSALAGVNVVLESMEGLTGAATDRNGLFVFTGITPGEYVIRASFVSYETYTDTLTVEFGDTRRVAIELVPITLEMDQMVVESEQTGSTRENEAGLRSVRPSDIQSTTSISVSKDLVDYLLTIPGIVSTGDRGGQLFVRGGTPTENLVLVDGVPIYQPFHIVGDLSAFPERIVNFADVYTGGFGARYGGSLSSVIDVSTKNGNKGRWAGSITADPFLSSAHVEGPLLKDELSVLASVRESTPTRYIPSIIRPELPYRFGDRFLKLHAYITPTSTLSGVAIQTFDEGDLAGTGKEQDRIGWNNEAYGIRLMHLPPSFPAIAEVRISTTRFSSSFGPELEPDRYSSTLGYRYDMNFIYLLKQVEARFGLFFRSMKFVYKLDADEEEGNYVSEGGFFLEADAQLTSRFRMVPGFRIHTFPSQGRSTFEPRFRASWTANKTHSFSFATGVYHQEIVGLNDQQDIGSVFTAWAPVNDEYGVPRAFHVIAGWQFEPKPWISGSLETYFKDLKDLTVLTGKFGFERGTGEVLGTDLQIRIRQRDWYGQASYSLSRVSYTTPSASFSPAHDRRQQINLNAGYEFNGYRIGMRWQFGSGFPFTRLLGFTDEAPINPSNNNHLTTAGIVAPHYGTPYGGRLPTYHRLDFSVEKSISHSRLEATAFAGIQNVYNRKNLFYFDLFTGRRINQLDRIPSIGLRVEIR